MRAIALIAFAFLAGCTPEEPTIDASNENTYQESVAAVSQGLSEEQRKALSEAMMFIALGDIAEAMESGGLLGAMAATPSDPGAIFAKMAPVVDGKTAQQVIQIADRKRAEWRDRQIAAAEAEIGTLEAELARIEQEDGSSRSSRGEFNISGSRFYWTDSSYPEPVIDFEIMNNSDQAIRRAYFHGILETLGRAVPWVDKPFNYSFPGGLEPGETQRLRLAPNRFSEWGHSDIRNRNDLVLTITIEDVEFADGKKLRSVSPSEIAEKKARLDHLRRRLEELRASEQSTTQ